MEIKRAGRVKPGTFGANPELIAELTNNFEFPRLFSALQNGDKKKNISIRANLSDRSFDFAEKKVRYLLI